MNKKLFLILLVSLAMIGCNSSTTDNDDPADLGSVFVADDNNTGSLEIDLSSSSIAVASTASFSVQVKDANGQPVNNVRVVCDTENDLRMIEPSSGSFYTGSYGSASGVLGCEDTGSFLFACGLGEGPGIRKSVLVKCEGTKPIGFTGFPGSYGGGLGNGVSDVGGDDEDDDDEFVVRITGIDFVEDGGNNQSVDLAFISNCDGDPTTVDPEPFSDTSIKFSVSNNTEQIVRYTSYSYVINNYDGSGGSFQSGVLNLIGEAVGKGGTGSFVGLFLNADGGQKYMFSSGSPLTDSGFKNVDFRLFGSLSDGTLIETTVSQAGSFGAFNRC